MKIKSIKKGATIGIFSPSEPITEDRIERFDKSIEILKSNGFNIKLAKNCMKANYYMAGTVEERIADINELLLDSEVDVLIASWGGKSCNQLLNSLNYKLIQEKKKPILAFSDGCVLLNAITNKTGLFTFHGPNVAGKMFETEHSDLNLIRNDIQSNNNILGNINKSEKRILKDGTAEGILFGGNLSTFVLGLNKNSYSNLLNNNGIFFWESMSETPQIIDQHLTFLKNNGFFDNLKGMVIGDFVTIDQSSYKNIDPYKMIEELTREFNFPIMHVKTFGHPENLENPIIPIGIKVQLDTKNFLLKLLEEIY